MRVKLCDGRYVRRYAKPGTVRAMLVGMNPGPWGMAQTGVPFGEVKAVRHFLRMPPTTRLGRPSDEHGERRVSGLRCTRSEVSGRRLWWDWARTHYASADDFFETFFVYNYCPLMWLETTGCNRPPNRLPASEQHTFQAACDDALRIVRSALGVRVVIGVGTYARDRCKKALAQQMVEEGVIVDSILHPSPASPAANRGWVDAVIDKTASILQAVEE